MLHLLSVLILKGKNCSDLWSYGEWSGVEWSGVEWSGVEWSGVEWSGRSLCRRKQLQLTSVNTSIGCLNLMLHLTFAFLVKEVGLEIGV